MKKKNFSKKKIANRNLPQNSKTGVMFQYCSKGYLYNIHALRDVIDGSEPCSFPYDNGSKIVLNNIKDGGDYPAALSSLLNNDVVDLADIVYEDAVMFSTHQPAGGSYGVGVLEKERESDYGIVGVADDASYQD